MADFEHSLPSMQETKLAPFFHDTNILRFHTSELSARDQILVVIFCSKQDLKVCLSLFNSELFVVFDFNFR